MSRYVEDVDEADRLNEIINKEQKPAGNAAYAQVDEWLTFRPRWIRITVYIFRGIFGLFGVYFFLVALSLFGAALQAMTKSLSSGLFQSQTGAGAALAIGIITTSFVQSSSTTTAIIVQLVASNLIDVSVAVPMIFGANIGTSVTSAIVSLFFAVDDRETFVRAFSHASCHGIFNFYNTAVWMVIEMIVMAFQREGEKTGVLFLIAKGMVGDIGDGNERTKDGVEFFKTLVEPVVEAIIDIDKDALTDLSNFPTISAEQVDCETDPVRTGYTMHSDANFERFQSFNVFNASSYCQASDSGGGFCRFCDDDGTVNEDIFFAVERAVNSSIVIVGGALKSKDGEDRDIRHGAAALVIAVFLIIASLTVIIYSLTLLISSNAKWLLDKILVYDFWGGRYLSIFIGLVFTVIVSSSSITTSLLVPLAAVDVLDFEQVYPLTIGANLGTTFSGLLVGFSSGNVKGAEIALVHTLFNVFGFLLWFPIPRMRAVVIRSAKFLGGMTEILIVFPFVYILLAYFAYPALLFGFSSGFQSGNPGGKAAASIIFIIFILCHVALGFWFFRRGGREKVMAYVERITAERKAKNANGYPKSERFAATPFPSFRPKSAI